MSTLVVLGAGDIGGATAMQAVAAGFARRVVLVDDAVDVARGKALDIRQASAIDGVNVEVIGTGDLGAVVGASVIVVADRHGQPSQEYHGDAAARLLGEARAMNPRALVVCAGATQFELIEQVVHEHGFDRKLIAGSAPEALRNGLIALTALASQTGPRDVSLMLVGRPPARALVVWNDAAVAGRRACDVLPPPAIARLDQQLPHLWPPGPLALGIAAARTARLAMTHAAGTPSLFTIAASAEGVAVRGVATAARVRGDGISPIWPSLSPRDQARFESALSG